MIGNVVLVVKPSMTDAELNTLFAAAWPDHRQVQFGPVLQRSLTWIAARSGDRLVGFVNVAIDQARASGMTWLHVDYEPHLDGFYRGCGFRETAAGLLHLA